MFVIVRDVEVVVPEQALSDDQIVRLVAAEADVARLPKAEDRVFLFLDLEGSTQLAERLGSALYFELLRRCLDDLTEPILETEGEIYQYAGDEIVVTNGV